MWNCRKNLIDSSKKATHKKIEIIDFLQKKKLDILCLVEAGLHGATSRHRRINPLTTRDIHNILGIAGYKLTLPSTWQAHGQARILVISREELQIKLHDPGAQNCDLPTITCEISLAREKKTVLNFF